MVLVFDTETNGLPKNYKADMRDTENWPRVVQFAWALFDDHGRIARSQQHIIKPDGWTIPEEASAVHGVTNEMAHAKGIAIKQALQVFIDDYNDCHTMVAHNFDFDYKIVGAEMIRANVRAARRPVAMKQVCTMKSSTDLCKIPGNYGYKWPKLEELHNHLFGEGFDGAHEALIDVLACGRCYFELKKIGVIQN